MLPKRLLYLGGRTLMRDALRVALARLGTALVPAVSVQQGIDEIARDACGVALVDDDTLGEAAAIEAVATLQRKDPAMRVGVVSASRSAVFPADAIRAGATAYFSKDMPLTEMRFAIERMTQDQMVVDPLVMRSLLGMLERDAVSANGQGRPHLSPVERRVLTLASEGHPNKQIAASLGLSPLTVKNHVARIRQRLGAADKAQAVAIALRGGLLD
ncbi:MAG TPA: response regulator transcription factor [Actinomycetota bacterium]